MNAPITTNAPADVIVENVDVPEEMIAAALAALEAGRMRADPYDGGPLGGMPPAFLCLDEAAMLKRPDGDPHAGVPLVSFLAETNAPTDAALMAEHAIAALRGRRVPASEIRRLHALLAHAHDVQGDDDHRTVVCTAPSPWHAGDSIHDDPATGRTVRATLDPEFVRRMPVAARLSIAYVGGREAIGLSGITSIGETDADAMIRLRVLADVDARPIGSGDLPLPWEPAR